MAHASEILAVAGFVWRAALQIPEPATIVMLSLGGALVLLHRYRRKIHL